MVYVSITQAASLLLTGLQKKHMCMKHLWVLN